MECRHKHFLKTKHVKPLIMKKISLAFLLVTSIISFSSCRKVTGEGPAIQQSRSEKNFTSIEMGVPGEMYYTPGSIFSIEITAQQNILDVIETNVSGGLLRVKVKNGVNIRSHEDIIVKVTAPDVTGLGVNGSGNIHVSAPYNPSFSRLSVNGSGDISIASLRTADLEGRISGSGKIEVFAGDADEETLSISGSGLIDIAGLIADRAKTNTSGSGNIRLHVVSSLDSKISGSGVVMYKGAPRVTTSISGSGKVIPL
jgi:hypothetical protein